MNALKRKKEKIVGILQPSYLPWLGYFEQICRSDVFVLYDDVQFEKGSWRNRNRIKTPQGIQWITVPVLTKGKPFQLIKDVCINRTPPWVKKHVQSIKQNYIKAPFYEHYAHDLFTILDKPWKYLIDLNLAVMDWLLMTLDIKTPTVLSSDLGIEGQHVDRLIEILKHFGGDVFYEGKAGENYIDSEVFSTAGIEVRYQNYKHPVYPQLYDEFVSHLSVIDLLLNCGPESRKTLMGKMETGLK